MDVLCERCNTRYEFDESLVSARGTTVKCTQCGMLFKVFPPDGGASVESWTVQCLNGERYVFRKMRELQAAISRGRVAPDDVLIPSAGRPKRLGDIEELATFFPTGAPDAKAAVQGHRTGGTRIGLAPPAEVKATRVEPAVARDREGQPLAARTGTTLPPPAVDAGPGIVASATGLPAALAAAGVDPADPDAPTLQIGLRDMLTPQPAPSSSVGEAVAAMQHALQDALGSEPSANSPAMPQSRPSASSRETRVRDDPDAPTRVAPLDRATRVRDEADAPTRLVGPSPAASASGVPEEPTGRALADRETRVRDEPEEPTWRMPQERDTRIRDDTREPVPVLPAAVREAVKPPRRQDTAPDLQVSAKGRPPTAAGQTDRESPDSSARPTQPRGPQAHPFEESELDITQDDQRELELLGHPEAHAPVEIRERYPSQPPDEPDSDGGESQPPATPSPSVARPSILGRPAAYSGPRFSSYAGGARRPSFTRWAVGLIVVGILGVGGYTAVRRYLPVAGPEPSARPLDARVDRLLRAGRERLVAGDLEGAREQFVMASGVDDQQPRVLEALADVEIVRADQAWLHLRLLRDDAPERSAIQASFESSAKRAEEAAERLGAAAARDRGAVRARLAVLRLRGDLDGARSLVDQLPNPGPEEAIVLALLDLGAPEPAWTTVLDRLQTAARAEQRLGRAAAYYVYAAALAGQPDRAREQLDLLGSYAPPHPLVEPLRRWLAERPAAADGGVGGGSPDNVDGGTAGGSDEGVPADFRQALKQAREALRDGKLDRADTLYQAALDKNPGNTEALAGLAEVAHARGDSAAAIRAYEGLLRQNPGYLPAMVALADLKWQTGAKAEARTLYRQVVEAAPGSSYAAHARSRLESGESSAEPKTAATATTQPAPKDTGPAPAPTNPEQPPAVPPGVDTSDLPDLH